MHCCSPATLARGARAAATAARRPAAVRRVASTALATPSRARVALRVTRVLGELGAIQLRRAAGVDVRVRSRKFREAFVRLGPAFVKIGQALSTRRDVLPAELCAELALLQDDMPVSLSGAEAVRVLEGELGARVDDLFEGLDASARPSQARVAVRMARITLELGIIQLRKMRNVDVAVRSVKMREAFIRCAFARAFSRAFRARSPRCYVFRRVGWGRRSSRSARR